jgi:hypothetical protein
MLELEVQVERVVIVFFQPNYIRDLSILFLIALLRELVGTTAKILTSLVFILKLAPAAAVVQVLLLGREDMEEARLVQEDRLWAGLVVEVA